MNIIITANVMFRLENEERYRRFGEFLLNQRIMNKRKMLKGFILMDNFNGKIISNVYRGTPSLDDQHLWRRITTKANGTDKS